MLALQSLPIAIFAAFATLTMMTADPARSAEKKTLMSNMRFDNLVKLCASDDPAKVGACATYIMGVLDGQALNEFETLPTLCYPNSTTDISAVVEKIGARLREAHRRPDLPPEQRNAPAAVPVTAVAVQNFLCPFEQSSTLELRGARFEEGPELTEMTEPRTKEKIYVAAEPLLTGQDILAAEVEASPDGPVVAVRFSAMGARLMRAWTAASIGQPLAIMIDGRLFSAPLIRETLNEPTMQISGRFTPEEARKLARRLEQPAN